MKKDNRGFSLIELVVVIAILAILISAISVNLGLLKKYHAKECRQMIYSSLENGRLISLSKSSGGTTVDDTTTYLSFFKNGADNCNYYAVVVEGEITDVKKISKSDVTIYFGPGNTPAAASSIDGFVCLDTYTVNTAPKNINITKVLEAGSGGWASDIANGYKIAFNRSTGGFLKDAGGSINLSIYANAGKYYYPVFLYRTTGKIKTGSVIIK